MRKLSIIIVNYNTGKLLAQCLHSIKEASNGLEEPETEIVIVDNASSDSSVDLALKEKLPLVLIKNKRNEGFAKSVNQGIKKSEGEFKLLLNPDTKVKKDTLKALVEFVERKSDAGVVGAKLLNPDGSTQASVFNFPSAWNAIREYWFGQKGAYSKFIPDTNFPKKVDAVVGAAFLITPKALEKAGFFDERYFMYFEDIDYCRKVKKAGLIVYYLPEVQVTHYHGVSGRGLAKRKEQWKRLIPSSKIYHGPIKHYLINFIIWSGQKLRRLKVD